MAFNRYITAPMLGYSSKDDAIDKVTFCFKGNLGGIKYVSVPASELARIREEITQYLIALETEKNGDSLGRL